MQLQSYLYIAAGVLLLGLIGAVYVLHADNGKLTAEKAQITQLAWDWKNNADAERTDKEKLKAKADEAVAALAASKQREDNLTTEAEHDGDKITEYARQHPEATGRVPAIVGDTLRGMR